MPKRTSTTGSELFIVDNSDEDWKMLAAAAASQNRRRVDVGDAEVAQRIQELRGVFEAKVPAELKPIRRGWNRGRPSSVNHRKIARLGANGSPSLRAPSERGNRVEFPHD
jgi:hypothetical protein